MKPARIIVLLIALVAGGFAALLVGRSGNEQAPPTPVVEKLDAVDVLVAKVDIAMGQTVTAQEVQWQPWPTVAASQHFIRRPDKPKAIEELSGSLARTPFVTGEPIREAKLIKANGSGFMAAVLPSGMRAISTEISAETAAAGFILPNDRVGVILTLRDRGETHTSETILNNVRVLAIDQTIEEKGGQEVVVGKTATLELTARQTETLALSRQLGTLSLALRSLADANRTTPEDSESDEARRGRELNMVRFGVPTTATQK
jgi:pilus assembly protein CpaB